MLEFLIALFGGTYYASRLGYEKMRNANSDAVWQAHFSDKDAWQKKWTNIELEEQLKEYIADYNNYSVVINEISPMLSEAPELLKYIGFDGSEWYECGLYSYYWTKHGMTKKKPEDQARSVRRVPLYAMLAVRGCVPSNTWDLNYAGDALCGRPAPIDIALFKWCVRTLRISANMQDPIVRIEPDRMYSPIWRYTFEPLLHPGANYTMVSDEEIVMMPK